MGEIAGSVAQLLATALACFDRIQIARNFDADLATHRIKLDIVQYRLSRWGEVTGICLSEDTQSTSVETGQDDAMAVSTQANSAALSPQDGEKAENLLKRLVEMIRKAEEKYTDMQPNYPSAEDSVSLEEHMGSRWRQLRQSVRSRLKKPKLQVQNAGRGLQWAFYKKDQFQTFIADISQILDGLEQLFSPNQVARVRELGSDLCKDLSEDSLQVLRRNVQDWDPLLKVSVDQILKPVGVTSVTFNTHKNEGSQLGYNNGSIYQSYGGTHIGTHQGTGNVSLTIPKELFPTR